MASHKVYLRTAEETLLQAEARRLRLEPKELLKLYLDRGRAALELEKLSTDVAKLRVLLELIARYAAFNFGAAEFAAMSRPELYAQAMQYREDVERLIQELEAGGSNAK